MLGEDGRVELDELEVGKRRSGAETRAARRRRRTRGVRRALPERGHAAGGEHGGRRGDGPSAVTTPSSGPSSRQRAGDLAAGQDLDDGMRERALGQRACDSLAGRGAAGADDSPPRVASLEAEPVVELDARVDEVDDPRGRVLGQGSHGARAAETPAGAERVFGVKRGESSGPTAAAMPPCASQLDEARTGPFETIATRASPAAAQSAAVRPAIPAPTTTTS